MLIQYLQNQMFKDKFNEDSCNEYNKISIEENCIQKVIENNGI